ncbi:MAG: hypothetical protein KAR42_09420 [candidate division Zixibacteria bacterium]|nr:hypothetical protein [candidate division Zixibacteria bacterium]
MNRLILSVMVVSLIFCSSLAFAQYEDDPYVEGFVAGNFTMPTGTLKNDMVPDSLNAKGSVGGVVGFGYYLKPKLVTGLYFGIRNMSTEEMGLHHRGYDFGLYGKYMFFDLTEKSFTPYLKLNAGVNFSKMATRVVGENGAVVFRELSYDPTMQGGLALGFHKKTNEFGAMFLEVGYHMDMMDGVKGEFKGKEYEFTENNGFMVVRLGILFNIGPKE